MRKAAALFALLLLWGLTLHWAQRLESEYSGVSVRMEEAADSETVKAAITADLGQSAGRVTAWHRGSSTQALEPTLGLYAQVRPVAVLGDMADVCPISVLGGSIPSAADEKGCVIDPDTALALFNNTHVVGAHLSINGNEYTVRCVAELQEPSVIYWGDGEGFENFEFSLADAEAAETFLFRYGLSAPHATVESGFYSHLAAGLCALPAWILALALLLPLLRQLWRRRNIPMQLFALCAAFFAAAWLLKLALGLELSVPARLLPTRWSDFDFWGQLVHEQLKAFEAVSFLTPLPKEMQWFELLRRFLSALALSCLLSVLMLYRSGKLMERAFAPAPLLLILLFTAASVWLLNLAGLPFVPSRGYLLSCPMWWLARSLRLAAAEHREALQSAH